MERPRRKSPRPRLIEDGARVAQAPPGADSESNFANDPMTLLWQNSDRETGAEAVEEIRARRRALGPQGKQKKRL